MTALSPTILSDLDGTLYTSSGAIDGAADAIRVLRAQGCTLRFFTNTDSRPDFILAQELQSRGFDVATSDVFTPASAARDLFEATPGARVLSLVSARLASTFAPFAAQAGESVTHVVVGAVDEILSYDVLDEAFRALRSGAELVALQRGRYSKHADGDHIDTGAIVAALEYAADVSARVIGKPSQEFIQLAAASAGVKASDVWVIGDDATTDIAMGNTAGAVTIQVQTGKFGDQAQERASNPATHTIGSIADLPALLASTMNRRV